VYRKVELLVIKTTSFGTKNTSDGVESRLDTTERKICEPEDTIGGTTQHKTPTT
jgi:hypothetical protein